MNTILTSGTVDANHQLRLDEPLSITGPKRVRVIILDAEENAISENNVFDFLKDEAEDIYTREDGKPFYEPS